MPWLPRDALPPCRVPAAGGGLPREWPVPGGAGAGAGSAFPVGSSRKGCPGAGPAARLSLGGLQAQRAGREARGMPPVPRPARVTGPAGSPGPHLSPLYHHISSRLYDSPPKTPNISKMSLGFYFAAGLCPPHCSNPPWKLNRDFLRDSHHFTPNGLNLFNHS